MEKNPFANREKYGTDYPLRVVQVRTQKLVIGGDTTNRINVEYSEYLAETQHKSFLCTDNSTGLTQKLYNGEVTVKGRELLLYIQLKLSPEKDSIKLPADDITRMFGWKDRQKLADAKAELANANIIAKMVNKEEYWINPYYIFNGDRKEYYLLNYPDNIQVVKTVTNNVDKSLTQQILALRNK